MFGGGRDLVALLVGVGLLAGACNSGVTDVGPGEFVGSQTSESSGTAAAGNESTRSEVAPSNDPGVDGELGVAPTDWVIYDLLEYMPATADGLSYVEVTDFERAAARVGLDWPGPTAAGEAADWVRELVVDGLPSSRPTGFELSGNILDIEGWRREVGFSLAEARAGARSDVFLDPVVLAVDASSSEVEAALRSDPIWSGELEERTSAFGTYYFWADDYFQNPDRRSSARPLGRGGAMAVRGEVVIRSAAVEPLETALELGNSGGGATDHPAVVALVNALDRTGVHTFFLSNEVIKIDPANPIPPLDVSASPEAIQEFRAVAADLPGHAPHVLFAGGVAFLDGRAVDVIAFYHGDNRLAIENTARIRELIETGSSVILNRPWSDIYDIESIDHLGKVSVAVLEPTNGNPGTPFNAYFNRDSLFWIAAS